MRAAHCGADWVAAPCQWGARGGAGLSKGGLPLYEYVTRVGDISSNAEGTVGHGLPLCCHRHSRAHPPTHPQILTLKFAEQR